MKLRFKVRAFLDWELSGHHEIVQKLYYRCPRSREIAKILGGQSVARHPVYKDKPKHEASGQSILVSSLREKVANTKE